MKGTDALAIEKLLASAHRSTWKAAHLLRCNARDTAAYDLEMIAEELRRVHESLLKTRSSTRSAIREPQLPYVSRVR